MVAKKTSTTKKATSAKANATTKKPVARKKSTSKAAAAVAHTSFRVAPTQDFFTFKISRQTVYWTILVVVIIIFQLLILKAQYEVVQANDDLLRQTELRTNER